MEANFAKAFRVVRAAYGLQQAEMARRLSVSPSQLSLIEKGKRQPSHKVISNLSVVTGVPPTLITLLASDPKHLSDHDISELAQALVRLLVAASDETEQKNLPFES